MGLFLQNAWLVPALPLLTCLLIALTPIRRNKGASVWVGIGCMTLATLVALGILADVAGHSAAHAASGEGFAFPEPALVQRFPWVATGSTVFEMGIYIDPIVAVMLAMVTIASTAIHFFSAGYMAGNHRQPRFFSYISLFTAAMLLMTLADNLLLFFMAWEVMGFCSFMLIGFIYTRPQAYRAAIKAFITTRIGDVLMLIGLVYLYTQAGSLAFGSAEGEIFNPELLARIGRETNALGLTHATAIALLLFCGTVGKSAQFPLHVWLPDAMEGPTPVSALIHAATMVAAGVFLVGRTYPIFVADGGAALTVVAFIGALTAIFAASIAVAQFDIKRILAYSTLSQLGFMVAALGIGGWTAAMFHLITHAFFKALLFLGSGAVIHAMEATPAIQHVHHEDGYAAQQTAQDIRNMGALRSRLPWTFWCYTAGYLALAGIVPFAGFWSKDEILSDAFSHGHWIVYLVLSLAAFLTAFYMTRQWRVVFFGSFRGEQPLVFVNPEPTHQHGGDTAHHGKGDNPWHEDWRMTAPLVLLAAFACFAGFFNLPFAGGHWLSNLLGQEGAELNVLVAGLSLIIAAAGIVAGWRYANAFRAAQDSDPLQQRAPALFNALNNRLYVDEFYAATFGRLSNGLALAWSWLDRSVFDRIVDGIGRLTMFFARLNFVIDDTALNDGPDALAGGTVATGDIARRSTTGKIQDYLALVFAGAVLLGIVYLYAIRG